MSEREQSGYNCATRMLKDSPGEKEAQAAYEAAEGDPYPDDFTRGWQKACLEHGAKIE